MGFDSSCGDDTSTRRRDIRLHYVVLDSESVLLFCVDIVHNIQVCDLEDPE